MTAAEQRLSKVAADTGDTVDAVRRQLGLVKVSNCGERETDGTCQGK